VKHNFKLIYNLIRWVVGVVFSARMVLSLTAFAKIFNCVSTAVSKNNFAWSYLYAYRV